MHIEVEQKFPLVDSEAIDRRLAEIGACRGSEMAQVDHYFNHPTRDFAQTDEALRLRQIGEANFVTYKGPKFDVATKTRRELELPLPVGAAMAESFTELLLALGFRKVATVRKLRRVFHLFWEGTEIEIALDEVERLGAFLEMELVADEAGVDAAKQRLTSLAAELQLTDSERRSYLELLLAVVK
ncbi:MAG: class IV adenylate cyclase [Pirellulales bacterium]|nr:class IV adenylate cyclase [Pirellulales bacterium]